MTVRQFVIPMTFAFALAIAATPANAQHGGGGHMGGGSAGGGHSGGGHMGGGSAGGGHSGGEHPRGGDGSFHGDRSFHGDSRGQERFEHRRVGPDVRGGRAFGGPFVHVRVIRPFFGPFFAFRPRVNLGFGLFLGYPVAYPWDYVVPYPYPYYPYDPDPYGSSYDDQHDNSYTPPDEQRDYGGISLDITPGDASVYVDGTYVGQAGTFSPSSAPLTLAPGQHHVVIEKPGYRSMTFDSDVTAGQVNPYQGTMQLQ